MSAAPDDEFLPPSSSTHAAPVALSQSAGAGLTALLIGCTLLISACVLMAFNVVLFRGGLGGIPIKLAIFGAVLGLGSVAAMGMVGIVIGIRGWSVAHADEPRVLAVGGTAAAIGGWVGWMIAATNLMMILLS